MNAGLACPEGLEPPTYSLEGYCSIQLSYGQMDLPGAWGSAWRAVSQIDSKGANHTRRTAWFWWLGGILPLSRDYSYNNSSPPPLATLAAWTMPHSLNLINTIAAALGLALVLGFLATRVRLPALVGYLLAGVVIGPYTPGFVADAAMASQLAEIGVMLLMFGVGLHFSLQDLMTVKAIAVPGALGQIAVATGIGALFGWGMGWGWGGTSLFYRKDPFHRADARPDYGAAVSYRATF